MGALIELGREGYHWLLGNLGWSGDLSGFQVLFLILGGLGLLFLLRKLSGSSRNVGFPGTKVDTGMPPTFYTGNPKLADFRPPNEVYDFRMPSPEIKTEGLKEPLNVDLELASKLFIAQKPEKTPGINPNLKSGIKLDWGLARKLFVPNFFQEGSENKGDSDVQEGE